MLNAEQSLALLWRRLVAVLSLIAAAALAPTVSAPVSGAGVVGSRAGNGAAVANAANAIIASVDALVEGGQHKAPPEASSDTHAKSWGLRASHELGARAPQSSSATSDTHDLHRPHAVRSGPSRAPPRA